MCGGVGMCARCLLDVCKPLTPPLLIGNDKVRSKQEGKHADTAGRPLEIKQYRHYSYQIKSQSYTTDDDGHMEAGNWQWGMKKI